jgi:hypothetical protein
MDDLERVDSQPDPPKRQVNVVVEILAWSVAAVALTATAYAAARYFGGLMGVG